MKKRLILMALFLLVCTGLLFAQIQACVGLESRVLSFVLNENQSLNAGSLDDYMPFYFMYTMQLGLQVGDFDLLDIGVGYKLWTVSLMFFSYPLVYADWYIGNFVLHGGLGGILVTELSPLGPTEQPTGLQLVTELGAYYKIGNTFQLGLATYLSLNSGFLGALPFLFCVSGRFAWDVYSFRH